MILNDKPSRVKSDSLRVSPFEINRRILAATSLSLAFKAVLIAILDHARYGASQCTATTRTLARECDVTERCVRKALVYLEGQGLIRIDREGESRHSRHAITPGPCLLQVGTEFRLRVVGAEVGTEFREIGTGKPETGEVHPYSGDKRSEKSGDFSLPPEEEIDPQTQRWFGHLLTDTTAPNATT